MDYKVFQNRIMVSFGDTCTFKCKYCYTFAKSFSNYPKKSANEIVDAVARFPNQNFENIYISCDTDSFVDQNRAIDLIEKLSSLKRNIHFTTKVTLSSITIEKLASLNEKLKENNRIIIPAVSICALDSFEKLEPHPIPTPLERVELIKKLYKKDFKVILAMRPFLPIVPVHEYKKIIDIVAPFIESVLGGAFYFDPEGVIEKRLGMKINEFQLSPLYFVEKPGLWKKYSGKNEELFVKEYCQKTNIDFFMTSPPAIEKIKRVHLVKK